MHTTTRLHPGGRTRETIGQYVTSIRMHSRRSKTTSHTSRTCPRIGSIGSYSARILRSTQSLIRLSSVMTRSSIQTHSLPRRSHFGASLQGNRRWHLNGNWSHTFWRVTQCSSHMVCNQKPSRSTVPLESTRKITHSRQSLLVSMSVKVSLCRRLQASQTSNAKQRKHP